jgi:hypothetical protein
VNLLRKWLLSSLTTAMLLTAVEAAHANPKSSGPKPSPRPAPHSSGPRPAPPRVSVQRPAPVTTASRPGCVLVPPRYIWVYYRYSADQVWMCYGGYLWSEDAEAAVATFVGSGLDAYAR